MSQNKNKSFNDYLNPIGSVLSEIERTFSNDSGFVIGSGGRVRHTGQFRSDNPYYDQLLVASNNKDKDALYERALEWEADYANRQLQIEENQAILDEQRAYDDPKAQVARQRAAGINPDIAASSGGSSGVSSGSDAQLSNPALADQQGQSKFFNAYDNTAEVFAGINTAINLVSGISGIAGTAVSAIDTLSTLPARRQLAEVSADVASRSADSMVSLAAGQAEAQHLSNLNSAIGFIENTSSLFTADSSDDDIAAFYRGAGVPEDKIVPYTNMLRQHYNNPAYKTWAEQNKMQYNQLRAHNRVYTPTLLSQLTEQGSRIQIAQGVFNENFAILRGRIVSLLGESSYADTVGNNIIATENLRAKNLKLASKQISRDIDVFSTQIADIGTEIGKIDMLQAGLISKYNQQFSIKKITDGSQLTGALKAQYDAYEVYKMQLRSLGSHNLNKLYDISLKAVQDSWVTNHLDNSGGVSPVLRWKHNDAFLRYQFSSVESGEVSSSDITTQVLRTAIGSIPYVGGILSNLIPE